MRWDKLWLVSLVWIGSVLFTACTPFPQMEAALTPNETPAQVDMALTPADSETLRPDDLANVISIQVTGEEMNYHFAVEILSPDTGCEQYADWWEVLTEEGHLVYRRILAHSHRDEQPFVRSGGPVPISTTTEVIVRAHLYPKGYGGQALIGTVENGFSPTHIASDFAGELADDPPLPTGCAF